MARHQWQPPTDQEELFRKRMCRHLISLTASFNRIKNGIVEPEEDIAVISGAPILIADKWCFLTAGHVIKDEILGPRERGEVRFNKWSLVDYFGDDPISKHPLPFDFDGAPFGWAYSESWGLDFAVILLRDFYVRGLKANRITPIHRTNWLNAANMDFDAYAMLGLPTSLMDTTNRMGERGPQIGKLIAPVLVWIEQIEALPDSVIPPENENWFFGKVDVPFRIQGMSGGPIFGFRKNSNEEWAYHAVAIQSGWYGESQIIMGCPLPIAMGFLESQLTHYYEENFGKSKGDNDES